MYEIGAQALGSAQLKFAFEMHARLDPARKRRRAGEFRYGDLTSGTIEGPRLRARFNTHGRDLGEDGVLPPRGAVTRIALRAHNGEQLWIEHLQFSTPSGDIRTLAFLDADDGGSYEWVNHTTFVVCPSGSGDVDSVRLAYYTAE